jgi:hypothetical protein
MHLRLSSVLDNNILLGQRIRTRNKQSIYHRQSYTKESNTSKASQTYQNGPGPICSALVPRRLLLLALPTPRCSLVAPAWSTSACSSSSCRLLSLLTNARYRPNLLRFCRPVDADAGGSSPKVGSDDEPASDPALAADRDSASEASSSGAAKSK